MGWFLIVWINVIAGFNMLIALYKTVKETYELIRDKCCNKGKVENVPQLKETEGQHKEEDGA